MDFRKAKELGEGPETPSTRKTVVSLEKEKDSYNPA